MICKKYLHEIYDVEILILKSFDVSVGNWQQSSGFNPQQHFETDLFQHSMQWHAHTHTSSQFSSPVSILLT